jgi:uncharacterized CHY-type Zn-finger protein
MKIDSNKFEAEAAMRAVFACQRSLTAQIATISRKRTWSMSERAIVIGECREHLASLKTLEAALCAPHNIYGY